MVAYAYMRYTRTNNSVLVICKDYNDQSRGSTLHSSWGDYKLMQTLDIR